MTKNKNRIHECPECDGSGIDNRYSDGKCDCCDGIGRITENTLWNYFDCNSDDEKHDEEALAYYESLEVPNTFFLD